MKKIYIILGVVAILVIVLFANKEINQKAADKAKTEVETGTTVPNEGRGILPFDSGVTGVVTMGPTCGAVREGETCPPKPYVGVVRASVIGIKSPTVYQAETNKEGRYKIMMPPGKYTIEPVVQGVLPHCSSQTVTVEPSKITETDLFCDTGIR